MEGPLLEVCFSNRTGDETKSNHGNNDTHKKKHKRTLFGLSSKAFMANTSVKSITDSSTVTPAIYAAGRLRLRIGRHLIVIS